MFSPISTEKRIKAAVIFLFFSLFFSGCARTRRREFQIWTISLRPLFTDYMKHVIAQWEQKHPGIKVKWLDLPINAIQQKLIVGLASGDPPSIVNLNTDMALQFKEMGVLENLDQDVPPRIRKKYFPGFWKNFAVPWYVAPEILIYNRKIFKKAGLNPNKPPKTWKELIHDSVIIKQKTGLYGWFPAIKFLDELQEQGIPVISPNKKKALFNNPEAVKWLNMYVQLLKKGDLPHEAILLGKAYQEAVDQYQAGNLGILMTGPQFLERIKQNSETVYRETRVAPLPLGKGNVYNAACMNLVIPKNAPLKQDAVSFLLFLTNQENQLKFCKKALVFPSLINAAKSPFFTHTSRKSLTSQARSIGASELKYAKDLTLELPHKRDLNEAVQNAVIKALWGEESSQTALNHAAKIWDRLLK
jgi:putative chitobiose transport system substrate-binding protein